jgi:phosphatidylglycerophosphate synthase
VDYLLLLAPAIVVVGLLLLGMLVYGWRRPPVFGFKHNRVFGPFLAGYLVWALGPLERRLIHRVTPTQITVVSLVLCLATGGVVAAGYVYIGVWLYAGAGIFDILDGRLARLANRDTKAGALFDSVSDRWGELAVFTGYAWYTHESIWLLAVMAAIAGSMMVSYTRARAESLGATASGGIMQRAERVVLVSGGTLIASLVPGEALPIIGVTLALCGLASCATAIRRWQLAHHSLARSLDNAQSAGTTATATTTQQTSPMMARMPNDASARLAAGTSDA